jgi:hypothetical protein
MACGSPRFERFISNGAPCRFGEPFGNPYLGPLHKTRQTIGRKSRKNAFGKYSLFTHLSQRFYRPPSFPLGFALAGRPAKQQLILVYGEKGQKMTWAQRAKTGLMPSTFNGAQSKVLQWAKQTGPRSENG